MKASRASLGFVLVTFGALFWSGAHCGKGGAKFDAGDDDAGNTIDTDGDLSPGDANSEFGDGAPVDKCHVPPDGTGDNAPMCMMPPAPPNSFSPKLKWTWDAPPPINGGLEGSIVTPLVGEFVDTNKDGEVNLCDIPSVIVATNGGPPGATGQIFMLAGDTGKVQFTFDGYVDGSVNPAFGDIDGDKLPEIIADDPQGHLVCYNNKGKIKWTSSTVGFHKGQLSSYCHAIAIHDLNGDGNPEIISAFEVYDNKGNRLFYNDMTQWQGHYWCPAMTAADVDGDGKMEAILGNAVYRANGQVLWTLPGPPGQPQVANLDKDPDPEIFFAREDGLLVVDGPTGNVLYGPIKPVNEPTSPNCWNKPAAVHDFDGDGIADLNMSTCDLYGVLTTSQNPPYLNLLWKATVNDTSGLASSTAFDFLGKGVANGVYGDQVALYVYDGKSGNQLFMENRSSGTLIEYPVVADVDNDGSADIVVVSNKSVGMYMHTVEVWQDAQKRWAPTRRIWNQHAYFVSNVREDGTIPKVPAKSWLKLNTFRTNAQIEGGGDCAPPPPNPPK